MFYYSGGSDGDSGGKLFVLYIFSCLRFKHTVLGIIIINNFFKEGRKEMFYLTMQSTHFIYGYMASDIWLRTIVIVREETRCRHIGYSTINNKGSFICTIPQTGQHIPQPVLHQSWSTGWNEK